MSPRPPRGAVRSREAGPSGGSPAPRAAGGRGPGGRWSGPGSPARGAGGGAAAGSVGRSRTSVRGSVKPEVGLLGRVPSS